MECHLQVKFFILSNINLLYWYISTYGEDDFDILLGLKLHESMTYPIASILSRDLLTIQVSTVHLESAFNIKECLINDYKSSLHLITVETTICLKGWWAID